MPIDFIPAAVAVYQGISAADSAGSAANTQSGSANQASELQKQAYADTQKNLAPFLQSGTQGANALNGLLLNKDGSLNNTSALTQPFTQKQYQESPYAAFLQQQGQDAAQNAASRSGISGNTLKALTQYGQGVAGQDYQQQFNNYTGQQNRLYSMLQNLAGSGQNAAVQQGGFGAQAASQIGANTIGAGNAQAAGQVGGTSAINNALNGLVNNPNINWSNLFSSPTTVNSAPSSGGGWFDAGSSILGSGGGEAFA